MAVPGIPDSLGPGGFRLTCYYYRKAYYRAFFLDPAGCAVGEPSGLCGFKRGRDYKGETRMLVFQNLHRYFLYVALASSFCCTSTWSVRACGQCWTNPGR
ncbi:MAG: hypothetical protein CM1200mP2_33220 [Planctomycetaceae bacterium]|nr:MAG: hypothetical protein CM1200mP2_33220 [Planctomycetaceae bacterium]